jgi:hypothetical protein
MIRDGCTHWTKQLAFFAPSASACFLTSALMVLPGCAVRASTTRQPQAMVVLADRQAGITS